MLSLVIVGAGALGHLALGLALLGPFWCVVGLLGYDGIPPGGEEKAGLGRIECTHVSNVRLLAALQAEFK